MMEPNNVYHDENREYTAECILMLYSKGCVRTVLTTVTGHF